MQSIKRAAHRLLVGTALLYCIIILALGLLWATQAELTWWLALLYVSVAHCPPSVATDSGAQTTDERR